MKKGIKISMFFVMAMISASLTVGVQRLSTIPSISVTTMQQGYKGNTDLKHSAMYESFAFVDTWGEINKDTRAQAVATNGSSDVYMAGYVYRGGIYQYDAFLMKYDADLRRVWNVTWGGFTNDKAYGVAVSNNYIFVTGSTMNATSGYLMMFLAKFDASGRIIWQKTLSNASYNVAGLSIATTADAVYIAGFDGTRATVVKYYQTGAMDWQKWIVYGTSPNATGVAVDAKYVYTCGYFTAGVKEGFVAICDFNMSYISALPFSVGSLDDTRPYGIAASSGYCYVAGTAGTSSTWSSYNAFLWKFDKASVIQWMKSWDYPGLSGRNDGALGVALKYNHVFFTGYSMQSYTVGYCVLATYNQDGTSVDNETYGLPGDNSFCRGVATGRNCVFIAGGTGASYSSNDTFYIIRVSTISHPYDFEYTQGTTGHSIIWTIYGALASTTREYYIYRDGVIVQSGTWNIVLYGDQVSINVDGLSMGTYNYTIVAGLIDGDVVQDTTFVQVLNAAPVISMQTTVSINGSKHGNVLSCTITDASTSSTTYVVDRNETAVQSGSWTSGVPIAWNIDGLDAGKYNFTVVVNDGLGGQTTAMTVATVNISPTQSGSQPVTPQTPQSFPTGSIDATLALAVLTLILVALHFTWHIFKKMKTERQGKDRS